MEEITGGAISAEGHVDQPFDRRGDLGWGLAMLRVLTGLLHPVAAGARLRRSRWDLTFFVPPIFTAIAFDSGGVASGPMTATFLLPFAMGACSGVGGNVVTDAFGVVAMVAMTPLITIQLLGVYYKYKSRGAGEAENPRRTPWS